MMRVRSGIRTIAWMAAGLTWGGPLLAQSNVSTGEILGAIQDSQAGVLPGATVTARNTSTGFSRSSTAGSDGAYRLDFLPVGLYDVRAEHKGFRTAVRQKLTLSLGASLRVDFALEPGTVTEEVLVEASVPLVETTRADVAAAVSEDQIANLPLNGRDFMDFIALTPQTVSDDEGRAHVGGMRGIQNSFNVDGANSQSSFFGEERGGTRPAFTFSQGAIKEFQVLPSSYSVQFGNASGGIINAVTKSGTNEVRGDLWYYYSDERFVEKDALDRDAREFQRHQFGAAVGGPIVRDKLHYYASYDGQLRDFPVPRGFRRFPAGREAEWEQKTGLSIAQELGDLVSSNDSTAILGKIDWQVKPGYLLTFRHNYSNYQGDNATNSFETSGASTNGTEKNRFHSAVATLNAAFSSRSFNELTVQFAREERPRLANTTALPETQISTAFDAVFGQNNFLPNYLTEKRWQVRETLTYVAGDHTLKAGLNADLVNFDDGFFRFQGGAYLFSNWDDFFRNRPAQYQQAFSGFEGKVVFDSQYFAGYVQDEWRASPRFTLLFGMRYDLQNNPTPQEAHAKFPDTGRIPDDTNNLGFRVGASWDPRGGGKTVLRGGFGYFYDTTPTLLLANAMLANGVRVVRATLSCATATCPAFPTRLPSLGALPTVAPDIFVFQSGYQNPDTKRYSFGAEHEIFNNLSVGGEFIYSETVHLERVRDLNLVVVGKTAFGTNLYDGRRKNFPAFGRIAQFRDDASAKYWALVFKARKRWADRWSLDASYTYSRSRDNNSNERSVSVNQNSAGEDQLDVMNDWGPSDFDVPHRFVARAMVSLPYRFRLSTIAQVRSGFPFTPTDARDLNGDRYFGDRAFIDGTHYARSSFRHGTFSNVDLRLSKAFGFGARREAELIGEVFNLLDADNLRTTQMQMVDSRGQRRSDFAAKAAGARPAVGSPRQYQLGMKLRF